MEKISPNAMGIEFKSNPGLMTGKTNGALQDWLGFSPSFLRFEKAGEIQIPADGGIFDRRCQGFAVVHTTALPLTP
jgi:hypothetical protein